MKEQDNLKENQDVAAMFQKNNPRPTPRKTILWAGSVVILVFSAITFVFLPGAAGGISSKTPVYGYYGRKPVAQTQGSYFVNRLSQNTSTASSRYEMKDQYRQAFDSALMRLYFEAHVGNSGYLVPDRKVDRQMLTYFEDENGTFLPRAYSETSNSTKISLFKNIKDNLTVSRYYDDLFGSSSETVDTYQLYGRKSSPAETAFYKKLGASQRSFDLAAFRLSAYPDSEVVAYINANKDLFTTYDLSVVTFDTEAKAKEVLGQLTKNEVTFADTVSASSNQAYSYGEGKLASNYRMYFQLKDILTKDADFTAVISLKPEVYSGVVKTTQGWSVFRGDGAPLPPDTAGDDAASLIAAAKTHITDNERGTVEDYFIARAKDFAAAAASDFDSACGAFDVTKVEVPAFPLNYSNSPLFSSVSSVGELSGAASDENFLKNIFSLKQGDVSAPYVLGDNVVVLRLKEIVDKTEDTEGQGGSIVMGNGDGTNRTFTMAEFYMQQYEQNALSTAVKNDKKVKDNFDKVFDKFFPNDF